MDTIEYADTTDQEYPVQVSGSPSEWGKQILGFLYNNPYKNPCYILLSPLSPQIEEGEERLFRVLSLSGRVILDPEAQKRRKVMGSLNKIERKLPTLETIQRYVGKVRELAQLINRGETEIFPYIKRGGCSAVAVSSTRVMLNWDNEYDYPFFVHQPRADNPTSELITRINEKGVVDPTEYTQTFLKKRVQMGIKVIYPELSDIEIMGFIRDFFDKQDPEDYEYIRRLLLSSLRLDEVIHESGIFSEYIKYRKRQLSLSTHH
jgi:hypothetical protein